MPRSGRRLDGGQRQEAEQQIRRGCNRLRLGMRGNCRLDVACSAPPLAEPFEAALCTR